MLICCPVAAAPRTTCCSSGSDSTRATPLTVVSFSCECTSLTTVDDVALRIGRRCGNAQDVRIMEPNVRPHGVRSPEEKLKKGEFTARCEPGLRERREIPRVREAGRTAARLEPSTR